VDRSRFAAAAVVSAVPIAIAARFVPTATTGLATAISTAWILALAWSDRVARQLPDGLVALAVLPTSMAAGVSALQGSGSALSGFCFGALIWALPLLALHVVRPADLGFGDVKAGAAIGATVGLSQPPVAVALALVVAVGAAAVAGASAGRPDVGLGPFFAGGAIGIVLAGRLAEELT
jgi:prepilin signal peptidase PulO-like enzyme (type II secretory pathway)